MSTYSAGDARLQVIPDASGFKKKLEADMSRIRAEFGLNVTAETGQARADIERLRESAQRNSINLNIDSDLGKLQAELAAFRAAQGRNAVKIPVELDRNQLQNSLERVRSDFNAGGTLKLDLAALGVSLIPGAVAGLADLAGALQQVAQAGLVIPGAVAGVGASIGTLAVGLSGVSDAYKEISKAAEQSGTDQAAQARAATQAQQQLRNAAVDDANAHKDLARAYGDARRELEDLNIQARGGQISEQQAVNDALKARRDLARGGFRDQLDLNDALLRVEAADQRVVEARQRNIETQQRLADANSRGIENSDRVVAAQERAVRSGQQVADAQAAVEQATAKTSSAAAAADAAMAKLSPNAQDLVRTMLSLKPVFEDFRNAVSQSLLEGVSGEIRTLVDTDLPLLQTGMSRIATALNKDFTTLLRSLGSSNSQSLLDRILGNTAEAQQRFGAAIDPLVRGIGALVAAGSDALPRLADDIARIAEQFATFIEAADKDGRLDKWINDGITGMEHLGSILKNLGSSFLSITRAAGGGAGLLGTLDKLTEKWAEFLKSDAGQQKLRDFFQHAREDLEKWRPILEALPGMFKGLLEAGQKVAEIVVPPIAKIADFLGKYPGLLTAVVEGFVAWKTLSFAANIVSEFGRISDVLGFAGSGKKGAGGKGLLGKLGVAIALFELLDAFQGSDDAAAADAGQAPGQVPVGELPVGTPIPFGGIPVIPPSAAVPVLEAAGAGGAVAGVPGAAIATLGSVLLSGQPEDNRSQADKDFNTFVAALPYAPDSDLKPIAAAMGVTVDALRSMSRDELHRRLTENAGATDTSLLSALPSIITGGRAGTSAASPIAPFSIPGRESGGPSPTSGLRGPTGGVITELHSDEHVFTAPDVSAMGGHDNVYAFRNALHRADGGPVIGPNGNPNTPGMLPGPSVATPAGNAPIAPAAATGGLLGTLGGINLGGGLGGMLSSLAGGGQQSQSGQGALLPGVWGLAQAAMSPSPESAFQQWGMQTLDWAGGFAQKTVSSFGSALLNGGLSIFGLEQSILSPSNPYFQAGTSVANFALGSDGPIAGLMGGSGLNGAALGSPEFGSRTVPLGDGGSLTVPTFGSAGAGGVPGLGAGLTPDSAPDPQLVGDNGPGEIGSAGYRQGQVGGIGRRGYGAGQGRYGSTGSDAHLVPNAVRAKHAVEAKFPAVATIGGWRQFDQFPDHPSGQAIDVMVPSWNTTAGKSYGDQIAAFLLSNSAALGVDYILWQQRQWNPGGKSSAMATRPGGATENHYDHVHTHVVRQNVGKPGLFAGGAVSGPGGPTDDKIPAWLSNDEHVFTAADVSAMGGHDNVYAFRNALHRADGGPVLQTTMPQSDPSKLIPKPPPVIPPPGGPNAVTPIGEPPPPPGAPPAADDGQPAADQPGAAPLPAPVEPPPQSPLPDQNTDAPPPEDIQRADEKNPLAGGAGMGAAPANRDHTLPAVNSAVMGGAQAIGSLITTAVAAAAAGGTMGAGAPAAGMAAPLIQGGIQQGAKVLTSGINVLSSFLVGNIPGSYGAADDATGYGQIVRAQQRDPVTAPAPRVQNNTFNGMDVPRVFQELDLRDAQHKQAALAGVRG